VTRKDINPHEPGPDEHIVQKRVRISLAFGIGGMGIPVDGRGRSRWTPPVGRECSRTLRACRRRDTKLPARAYRTEQQRFMGDPTRFWLWPWP
jgi:hypothetical protein